MSLGCPLPNPVAQTFDVVLPRAIAIYLSRRDGDLAAVPHPHWWPGTVEPEQRGEPCPGLRWDERLRRAGAMVLAASPPLTDSVDDGRGGAA